MFYANSHDSVSDTLNSEFSDEGLNGRIEHDDLECRVESSRTENHVELSTRWSKDYTRET